MTVSLFRLGVVPRLAGALAFGLLAFGMVFWVGERPGNVDASETGDTVAPAPLEDVDADLPAREREVVEIDSVRAVESWTIRMDGESPQVIASDAHRWSGSSGASSAILSIEARVAPSDAPKDASNCLRIRLRSGKRALEWMEWVEPGELVLVPIGELRAGAPPPLSAGVQEWPGRAVAEPRGASPSLESERGRGPAFAGGYGGQDFGELNRVAARDHPVGHIRDSFDARSGPVPRKSRP